MTQKEINTFVDDCDPQRLEGFYNKIYEKVERLDNRMRTILLYIVIVVFLYLLISSNTIFSSLQIGPISITDISMIAKLFPLLFSYLMFELITTSAHRVESNLILEIVYFKIYKQEKLNDKGKRFFMRVGLPYATWNDVFRIGENMSGKLSCFFFSILIIIPLIIVFFLPLYFEYLLLKDLYIKYYNETIGKLSFYISIWLSIISIWHFFFQVKNSEELKKVTTTNGA